MTTLNARNDKVIDLLGWHGHSSGGVRVPFSAKMGRPLGSQVVPTTIVAKLAATASDVAAGLPYPSLIFLVGGPGNGKSDAVETFVEALDASLGCGGALTGEVASRYAGGTIIPRRIDVTAADVSVGKFGSTLGRLTVVQDASGSESRTDDAARSLLIEVADVLIAPAPFDWRRDSDARRSGKRQRSVGRYAGIRSRSVRGERQSAGTRADPSRPARGQRVLGSLLAVA